MLPGRQRSASVAAYRGCAAACARRDGLTRKPVPTGANFLAGANARRGRPRLPPRFRHANRVISLVIMVKSWGKVPRGMVRSGRRCGWAFWAARV
jgi:hypothetical protein